MPDVAYFSAEELSAYQRDGFLIVRELLSKRETSLLHDVARGDLEMVRAAASRADGEGGAIRLHVENRLAEDDLYSAICRNERIVRRMEQLLDDEVYHYHHKMILKEPRVGGAWAWHQDYGYWYNNGCLSPDLASCMIAVDQATRANGCLQVVRGTHRLGRIDHMKVGDQTGADPERVQAILERMELVYVQLEPGDAVFFHSNLLHRSDQNRSDAPRWAFICCYNAKRNDPYKESRHPRYEPLAVLPNDALDKIGQRHASRLGATVGSAGTSG